jgi:hypothetical protein
MGRKELKGAPVLMESLAGCSLGACPAHGQSTDPADPELLLENMSLRLPAKRVVATSGGTHGSRKPTGKEETGDSEGRLAAIAVPNFAEMTTHAHHKTTRK